MRRGAARNPVRATVSLCPELDIASQGGAIEEARAHLVEALTLFFETASPSELDRRLHSEVLVTRVEAPIGRVWGTRAAADEFGGAGRTV